MSAMSNHCKDIIAKNCNHICTTYIKKVKSASLLNNNVCLIVYYKKQDKSQLNKYFAQDYIIAKI